MTYHGQLEQDRYFVDFIVRGRRGGRFLDVGAHDGVAMSNTLALERDFGWSGVCVEADPEMAEACRIARPASRVVSAAAWDRVEQLVLSRPLDGDRKLARVSGMDVNRDYFATQFTVTFDIQVEARPLRYIIAGESWFDFCSIDVEGAEIQALDGIDWNATRFGFLVIEHGNRPGMLERICGYMAARGYSLHRVYFHDAEFIAPGFAVPPGGA